VLFEFGATFGARRKYLSMSLRFRRSSAFTQEVIRSPQGAYVLA